MSILEITTKNGKYIIMRNGSNLGDYNYAVLDLPKNKWHWGKNSLEAIEIVELLSATKDNLPLLIGITSPKLLTLLERRLKGL